MHSINALENKSITSESVTHWTIILFSLIVSQERKEEGYYPVSLSLSALCLSVVRRLMLGFIMAKEINSFCHHSLAGSTC